MRGDPPRATLLRSEYPSFVANIVLSMFCPFSMPINKKKLSCALRFFAANIPLLNGPAGGPY